MAGANLTPPECFRLPPGVEFQRWQGEAEWVVYHAGTGETMRLSDAAVAVLDLLAPVEGMGRDALEAGLNAMMDAPLPEAEMQAALGELLRILLSHECVERVPCG